MIRLSCSIVPILTHWGLDKLAAISQTTFSNAFSWMKMNEFYLWFHWSLFLRFELTIFRHWFRPWLGAGQLRLSCTNSSIYNPIITHAKHYEDVIMSAIASQITSLTVVYSTVYWDADQRNYQSSALLAFVWGIHRARWIPRTKGQLRGKCFHLMTSSWPYMVHSLWSDIYRFYQKSSWLLNHHCASDTLVLFHCTNLNTLRPRQTCRHFADDIFKCIFLNENEWILFTISLKFVPKVRINNIPALV